MHLKAKGFGEMMRQWWQDSMLLTCFVGAAILHVVLLMVHFQMPTPADAATKDVALSIHITQAAIEKADYLAQKNQQGSGQLQDAYRMSSQLPRSMPEQNTGKVEMPTPSQINQKQELKFEDKILMTILSWQKQADESQRKKAQENFESQMQAKSAMIASVEAQYLKRQQNFSRQQRIKTVDGIQAKQDASASYLNKFRDKVEMYGNRYYPDEAKRLNLSGEVRLMVILNAQGGIRAIRLLQSSGHAVLDEAAKASVRRGAPFGHFDQAMQDISELRIIRTWKFHSAQSEFDIR